jgi:hypothetical protein
LFSSGPSLSSRRALRVALAGFALALAAGLPGVQVHQARAADPADQPPPIAVRLASLTPIAPQPGDTLTLAGDLHNTSAQSISGLHLSFVYRRTRIGSRDEFDHYANTLDGSMPPDALTTSAATVTLGLTTLDPGQSTTFHVAVPVDSLDLPRESWQVYAIGLHLTGLTQLGEQTVGALRTFLPWAPLGVPGVGVKTQVAWVWPLADRPHRLVATTWSDDALAAELALGGRLRSLVTIGSQAETQGPHAAKPHPRVKNPKPAAPRPTVAPVPVTWAVDPMLLEDATQMAGGYRVGTGGRAKQGTGTAAATSWLADLRDAANHGEVLSLPYADPDLVAADRAGLGSEVQLALHNGQSLVASTLSVSPLNYLWPPDGVLDDRSLDLVFAAGVSTVVLNAGSLPVIGGQPSETPSAHTVVRGRDSNLDALLVDDGLSAVVDTGLTDPSLQPLAVQRFLAETLMIQAELPSDQRTLVITPDRRWAPDPAYAKALLSNTGRVPWIQPVTLSDAASSPVYTKVTRGPLSYPSAARARELGSIYLARVRATKSRADSFAAILLPFGAPTARAFDDAVLRSLSSAWRDDRTEGTHELQSVREDLAATMGKVRIASAPNSFVTLTSHSGTVPVTVSNELDNPVHVVVGISSQHLKLSGRGRTAEVIPAHRAIPIDVRAAAQTAGVFPLDVTLYTPSGQTYQKVKLYVRSTAYGAVTIAITGGATGVLLLAVLVRLVRRASAARRASRAQVT